jgi:hypothetical protein
MGVTVFSRFTASARRVMQRAFREAKRWQHDFVGTEHLLYGLLCDADGPAVELLRSVNARPELLLQKVELSLERHDGGMAMEQFPLSPASKRVFQAALDEATQFQHQLIGPPHILLGLLRESECEAAQLLAAHSVKLDGMRAAIAALPPDEAQEAKFQSEDRSRVPAGDNPSADELERWVAPPITHEQEYDPVQIHPSPLPQENPLQEVEAQVRRTQLVLGAVLGFAFGYWLAGWMLGSTLALAGFGVATFRSSWLGIAVGVTCGLLIVPLFQTDLSSPAYPILFGALGGFLGSFLGDGWRFSHAGPVKQPPSALLHDDVKSDEAGEVRQQNAVRSSK